MRRLRASTALCYFSELLLPTAAREGPEHGGTCRAECEQFTELADLIVPRVLTNMQLQDFLRLYNNLSMRCFEDCVTDFTTRSVTPKEVRALLSLHWGLA